MHSISVVTGRLGGDPESRTVGENNISSFSVAEDRGFGDKKRTVWWKVTVWGKGAEACQKYLSKGAIVTATGQVSSNAWIDKQGEPRAQLNLDSRDVTFVQLAKDPSQSDNTPPPADPGDEMPF